MEVLRGHSAIERILPSITSGIRGASRFAVLAAILTISGDDGKPDRPNPFLASLPRDVAPKEIDPWERPDALADGTSLIGKKLRIDGETSCENGTETKGEDILLEVRLRDRELELVVNGKTYRIQDAMNVEVGKSIVSADITDGVITIVTTEHGTAKVDRTEVERIVRQLAGATGDTVPVDVCTLFEPKGAILTGSINVNRWCRGWKPGDKETYPFVWEAVRQNDALALAYQR